MKRSWPSSWPMHPCPEAWARGRWNLRYWAKVYLGIDLHPGQERMAKAYLGRSSNRWKALYLWIMVAAGNRAGKTAGLAIIIVHSCVYRMGLEPPDPKDEAAVRRWGKLPYHWWHFAVEQGPSELVFAEIKMMLKGEHPAQKAGCPWSEQVGGYEKIAAMTDEPNGSKERGEYAWVRFAPELGGAEVHFRSTKAKALSAIGQNMHGLSFDEAGLETNLTFLLEEVMHARRLGTGGQFIIISTPSAATSPDFEDLWYTGDPEDPFRKPRRLSLNMSTRDNIGFGIDQEDFDALIDGMPEDWVLQNIDGRFIQAALAWFNSVSVDSIFHPSLPEEEPPHKQEVYVHALDPGLTDKCWSLVCRVIGSGPNARLRGVSIQRMRGKQTTRGIVRLGKTSHHAYAKPEGALVLTGVDTTALGGHMFKELLEEDDPNDQDMKGIASQSVEFGGVSQIKRRLLSDLRTAVDEGRIELPTEGFWADARKQLRNYKLLDRKIEQDLVMCLAIAVKLMRQAPSKGTPERVVFQLGGDHNERAPEDPDVNAKNLRAGMARKREQRRAALAAAAADSVG